MELSAKDVKQLAIKTGASMLDCKRALSEREGNMEEAIKLLTERNANKNAKRVGLLFCKVNQSCTTGVMIELSCETDIVSQAPDIKDLGDNITRLALEQAENFTDVKGLKALQMADGRTVSEHLLEATNRVGENIDIRECKLITGKDYISHYISSDSSRVAIVWFFLQVQSSLEILELVTKDLAIHVVAMKPKALDVNDMPAEIVQKERKIALDSVQQDVKNAGKPLEFLEKIVDAKLDVFFRENTLLNQIFFKDKSITVAEYLKNSLGNSFNDFKVAGFDYIFLD